MRDCFHLLLGVVDPARDDCAAKRVSTGFENESTWRKMIGKSVVHNVTRPKTGGKQSARCVPPVDAVSLGFEDWPWRHQQTLKLCRRGYVKAAEGRLYLLSFFQV